MKNAGTIPEAVLSALSLPAQSGQQRRCPAAVRPTRQLRLRWCAGENLTPSVLSCGGSLASGAVWNTGFAR